MNLIDKTLTSLLQLNAGISTRSIKLEENFPFERFFKATEKFLNQQQKTAEVPAVVAVCGLFVEVPPPGNVQV